MHLAVPLLQPSIPYTADAPPSTIHRGLIRKASPIRPSLNKGIASTYPQSVHAVREKTYGAQPCVCQLCRMSSPFRNFSHNISCPTTSCSWQKHLKNSKTKWSCRLCERSFQRSNSLRVHLIRHANIRSFKCEQCSKDFTEKYDLKRHVLAVHLKYRPFTCSICPKKFSSKPRLIRHNNTAHSDDSDKMLNTSAGSSGSGSSSVTTSS